MNIELKYLSEVESRWHWASVDREKSSNRNLAAAAFTLPHSPGRAVAKSSSEKILDKENEVIGKEKHCENSRYSCTKEILILIFIHSYNRSPLSHSIALFCELTQNFTSHSYFFSSLLIEILVQKQ